MGVCVCLPCLYNFLCICVSFAFPFSGPQMFSYENDVILPWWLNWAIWKPSSVVGNMWDHWINWSMTPFSLSVSSCCLLNVAITVTSMSVSVITVLSESCSTSSLIFTAVCTLSQHIISCSLLDKIHSLRCVLTSSLPERDSLYCWTRITKLFSSLCFSWLNFHSVFLVTDCNIGNRTFCSFHKRIFFVGRKSFAGCSSSLGKLLEILVYLEFLQNHECFKKVVC